MSLIPIIRGRRSPPRLGDGRDANIPPGRFQGEMLSVSDIDAILGFETDRQLVIEGEYTPHDGPLFDGLAGTPFPTGGFVDGYTVGGRNYTWFQTPTGGGPFASFNNSARVNSNPKDGPTYPPNGLANMSYSFVTLNGADAIKFSWHGNVNGGETNYVNRRLSPQTTNRDKFGTQINLTAHPAIPASEGWLTWEARFTSGWGARLGKIGPKIGSVGNNANTLAEHNCNVHGWQGRTMWRPEGFPDDIQLTHYRYGPDHNRSQNPHSSPAAFDVLHIIEFYFKLNTDPNLADGIVIVKDNDVIKVNENMRMWCGSDNGPALINKLVWTNFCGGNNEGHWPTAEAELTLGRWKFEVPI